MQELLRRLPKVDQLVESPEFGELTSSRPRALVLAAVRAVLDDLRAAIRRGEEPDLAPGPLAAAVRARADEMDRPSFRRVVNATGVVVHTNLGRSLLADEAVRAVESAARHYSNLEFDLAAGRRGLRYTHAAGLLCELTGAEAALVVNNNAAAVLITLQTLAAGREVVVSRGELVEIGGSFRIPEVMEKSGARLVEVGTTNKTRPADYENAVGEDTALLMKVHQSNFRMVGFTESVSAADLSRIGRARGVPVMEDLGSGTLVDFSQHGLRPEPTVQQAVAAGTDVICFSGDKLLGGPQAGIIVGRASIVESIRKNPLNRALRIDKFTVAALEATLRLYKNEEALEKVPTLAAAARPYDVLRRRAARLKRKIEAAAGDGLEVKLVDGYSQIGGGALPDQNLKTRLAALKPKKMSVNELEEFFRSRPTPIIARIEDDRLMLDVRTMLDEDFALAAEAAARAAGVEEA